MLAGFIVGIPMFYSVGFVILIPIVFTMAAATGLPLIFIASTDQSDAVAARCPITISMLTWQVWRMTWRRLRRSALPPSAG